MSTDKEQRKPGMNKPKDISALIALLSQEKNYKMIEKYAKKYKDCCSAS
jgi:hypothetical protein